MKTKLDLNVLSALNEDRCNSVFHPISEWTLNDWACAMAGEAGEVCNEVKKIKRGDYDSDPSLGLGRLAMEMADVVIYLDLLATRAGINLGNAVIEKFNHVSDKRGYSGKLP